MRKYGIVLSALIIALSISYVINVLHLDDLLFETENSKKRTTPIEMNRAADRMLMGIEEAVRADDEAQFGTYFTDRFDTDAWYHVYYSEVNLHGDRRKSFTVRRFGDVVIVDKEKSKMKFVTSYLRNNETKELQIRSYGATIIKLNKVEPIVVAIQTIRLMND